MVEHPNQFFGPENLSRYLTDQEDLRASTWPSPERIRRAIQTDRPTAVRPQGQQRPPSVSRTGFGFYFDGVAAGYCLIRFAGPDDQ